MASRLNVEGTRYTAQLNIVIRYIQQTIELMKDNDIILLSTVHKIVFGRHDTNTFSKRTKSVKRLARIYDVCTS